MVLLVVPVNPAAGVKVTVPAALATAVPLSGALAITTEPVLMTPDVAMVSLASTGMVTAAPKLMTV